MPPSVLHAGGRVPEIVLAAQLVGNSGGCGIQIARTSYDLGASAAVVGDFAQRSHVHMVVIRAISAARRRRRERRRRGRRWPATATAGHREWPRNWQPWRLRTLSAALADANRLVAVLGLAVDPDRVDQHLGLANHPLH